jgi:hypothetical protein
MRTLIGIIPFVAMALLAYRWHQRGGLRRRSFLSAAIIWGLVVTAISETLSLFRSLSFWWILIAWLVVVAVFAMKRSLGTAVRRPHPSGPVLESGWWCALVGVAVVVSGVGLIALLAPPNTSDSLTYHMPRVAHWVQNRSVVNYPTHIPRQLHLAPWSEFAIMQFQVLSGGDRLANLIQWLAMLGSLLGVSLITHQLGGDWRCQVLAVVVVATIPMGILQSTGTQTDYVVSFWLVCFVSYVVEFARSEGAIGHDAEAMWAGASLGLAILTKATAYVVGLPFVLWLLGRAWQRRSWRTPVILLLVVFVINAGHWSRNVQLYGSPLGPGREGPFRYANEAFGPSRLISNAVRNIALHICTPTERINGVLDDAISRLHGVLGIDINDPKTTWPLTTFHVPAPHYAFHEDYAGNPLHAALIALSCLMLLAVQKLRRRRDLLTYAGALITAFLVFVLYLKWQPWHSRLHLPLFVLWSPIIGVIWGQHQRLTKVLAALLLIMCLPWVTCNSSRPLLGQESVISRSRVDQYFSNWSGLREPIVAAMARFKESGCTNLGLWIDGVEYPVWVLAGQEAGRSEVRIEHVYVKNASLRSPLASEVAAFDPCAILLIVAHPMFVATPTFPAALPYKGSVYRLKFRQHPVALFLRE